MLQKILIPILLFGIRTALFAQELPLHKEKISKEITMKVADELSPMSAQLRIQKYVSDREPIAMFTTQDGQVDLGVNVNSSYWRESDYQILRDFYRSGVLNLYDEVEFYQDTLLTINNRPFIVFEFKGVILGKEGSFKGSQPLNKYVHIQYTLKDDQVLLFNFSAPYSGRRRWEKAVKEMMNSIKIK